MTRRVALKARIYKPRSVVYDKYRHITFVIASQRHRRHVSQSLFLDRPVARRGGGVLFRDSGGSGRGCCQSRLLIGKALGAGYGYGLGRSAHYGGYGYPGHYYGRPYGYGYGGHHYW
ncbi:hypothetical protein DAPPUDRAFT_227077 [Daphnia pulex]|uniref:Uncharacterized protein n=1 Tax=Daphnia pulex TaxID=6669 RepID=E9H3N4_DAPPU|nr:hypothetical protein DAPPUDRAFT_227077 [Daphnia pulex]|eukprot:EFX73541.1 hypothetical protein DAPPUDRAFT_227077 [Daphnia pulex]